jgi:hypothetical protein
MESPYEERQLHPVKAAMAAESVQRVVISGQAWGKSSKVVNSHEVLGIAQTLYRDIIKR